MKATECNEAEIEIKVKYHEKKHMRSGRSQ